MQQPMPPPMGGACGGPLNFGGCNSGMGGNCNGRVLDDEAKGPHHVVAVRFASRMSSSFTQAWEWYCSMKGNGSTQATGYDEAFIASFFDTIAGAAMTRDEN